MSYTEIYKFKKNGDAELIGETKNAFRGAMAVWNIIDERYLPPYHPLWTNDTSKRYYRSASMDNSELQKVWDLFDSPEISETDKYCLGSTLDNVIVVKKDIPRLLEYFRNFEGETSLKEQADIIENSLKNDDDLIAIAWNQTSVNASTWQSERMDKKKENYLPYNVGKEKKHWNLFY